MIMIEYLIGRDTTKDILIRLKKAIQFIHEVVEDYNKRPIHHLNFALMLAISKAEELCDQVDPFCRTYPSFKELAEVIRDVPNSHEAREAVEKCIAEIRRYFDLEHVVLKPKTRTPKINNAEFGTRNAESGN